MAYSIARITRGLKFIHWVAFLKRCSAAIIKQSLAIAAARHWVERGCVDRNYSRKLA